MYPLHDHDLDRLSREAAEHFEVEPGASGWEHLEKRLDQELPQKKKRRRFLFWLFFITATTGGALTGILTYKPVNPLGKNAAGMVSSAQNPTVAQQQQSNTAASNGVENTPATGSESTPVAPAQAATTPAPVANNPGSVTPSTTPAAPSKSNTVNAPQPAPSALATMPGQRTTQPVTNNTQKSTAAPSELADKSPLSLNYATKTPVNKDKNNWHTTKPSSNKPGKQQRNKAGQHKQTISPVPDNNTVADAGITTTDQQQTIAEPVEVNKEPSTPAQAAATPVDSTKNNAVAPPVTDSTKTLVKETPKKEADPKKDKKEKGFELGLIAGPDVSTVKFGPLYKAGYNFGLQVGYRFSNRWSVNTGIIYTKKWYQAAGEDFHYKNPNWNAPIDKAEGNCSMWEIPVNVRYDVSFNTKRRWFVSTGLSTYLMDKEKYDVYYTWGGNNYSWPLNNDTNSHYLFSILNLSVGMERSLGKHFSIQAEPYLKVPLQGLGKGDMRMDSYGMYFTLKFKPGFRTKK